jgi:sugar phosphate isomerase/epimerase
MKIGAMNHPAREIAAEIRWMAEMGLDFLDLTLEPPSATSWRVDAREVRRLLEEYNLGVVGHTAYYIPMASPFEEIRQASVAEFRRCIRQFAEIGVKWMNIHPDRHAPMHNRAFYIQRNIQTLEELLPEAEACGVGLMIENLPGDFNSPAQLGELLDPLPSLGLHLDIGHSNLMVPHNTCGEILAAYGDRLRHVHLHDNKGGHADLHLPLGSGTLDVAKEVAALKKFGYDGTITLEVFTPDTHYLAYSRDVLRRLWEV